MIDEIRQRFLIFQKHPDLVYLDTAATAQKPDVVIEALCDFYQNDYATVHRGIYDLSVKATDRYHAAREALKQFVCLGKSSELVFTKNTTAALNLVAFGFAKQLLQPGDQILITSVEHHSNLVCWQKICEQTKAQLVVIEYQDLFDVAAIAKYFNPQVKLFAFPHVSNVLGYTFPVKQLVALARSLGVYTCVDGAQAVAHQKVNLQDLNPDFYAFSAHKMYGPSGVGALCGKLNLLERCSPLEYGGDMVDEVSFNHITYQQPPLKFEAGTPSIASVIAWKAAIDFLNSYDLEEVFAHEAALTHCLKQELKSLGAFLLHDQGESLVSFTLDQVHPFDLTTLLDQHNIAIRSGTLCSQNTLQIFGLHHVMRASMGMYTSQEDIEKLLEAIKESLKILV